MIEVRRAVNWGVSGQFYDVWVHLRLGTFPSEEEAQKFFEKRVHNDFSQLLKKGHGGFPWDIYVKGSAERRGDRVYLLLEFAAYLPDFGGRRVYTYWIEREVLEKRKKWIRLAGRLEDEDVVIEDPFPAGVEIRWEYMYYRFWNDQRRGFWFLVGPFEDESEAERFFKEKVHNLSDGLVVGCAAARGGLTYLRIRARAWRRREQLWVRSAKPRLAEALTKRGWRFKDTFYSPEAQEIYACDPPGYEYW